MNLTTQERAIVLVALQVWLRKLDEDPAWNHGGNTLLREASERLLDLYEVEQREAQRQRSLLERSR